MSLTSLIIAIFILVLISCHAITDRNGFGCGLFVGFLGALFLASIATSSEPKAIDVYEGRTTLEITYKDSVAVDTVVVFKDEYLLINK